MASSPSYKQQKKNSTFFFLFVCRNLFFFPTIKPAQSTNSIIKKYQVCCKSSWAPISP